MPDALEVREAALYDDWKQYGPHLEEYASEFLGTAFLLICVVGIVALTFSASSPLPHLLPSPFLRLALIGLVLGLASWAVALSPPGRLSGAHLDPAISAGFLLLGKMHPRDFLGYVVGQMGGAVAGTLLGGVIFGSWAKSVQMGSLHPGPHVSVLETWAGELASTFVLAFAVFFCVGIPRLARWTPGAATIMLVLLIGIDGNFSGAGMNPARWFGPALAAHLWLAGTAYAFAPVLAGFAAAALRRVLLPGHTTVHTAKLFHDPRYRSIFRNDRAASRPPESVRRASLFASSQVTSQGPP